MKRENLIDYFVFLLFLGCTWSCVANDTVDSERQLETYVDVYYYKYHSDGTLLVVNKYKGNQEYDLVQIWGYDLQQSLDKIFTFKHIYLSRHGSISKIALPRRDIDIMSQSSDCVLATRLNRFEDFSGTKEIDNTYCSGNHCLDYNGIQYKTAETINVEILVDGEKASLGDEGYASTIEIMVESVAYDPFVLIDSIQNSEVEPVYDPIFEERLLYRIKRGSIHCIDDRLYKKKTNVETYGGFASMSVDLRYCYFPCGQLMPNADEKRFGELLTNIGLTNKECNKRDYPDFNHFIKKNKEENIYECVYIPAIGIGDHSEIPDDYSMYWVYNGIGQTWKKVYHRLTYHKHFEPLEKQYLECYYTWFTPYADTVDYISFMIDDMLFIDIKRPYEGLVLCGESLKNNMKIIELVKKTQSIISYDRKGEVLYIDATEPGSLILKLI